MRIFHVTPQRFAELSALPVELPREGFLWLGVSRDQFAQRLPDIQAAMGTWAIGALLDLHASDLLSQQLPSHYEDTSWYDMLVFRRLAATTSMREELAAPDKGARMLPEEAIDTSPVGFVVYDRLLLTVHPEDCLVREHFAQRLIQQGQENDVRGNARLPTNPADLMLRMVNHMVDSYLDLRRWLTREFSELQNDLFSPRSQFADWQALLAARNALHLLETTCEDQRDAVQEWIDALEEWPEDGTSGQRRERELLRVRSRDVLEHIERVLNHVRRLEQSAETAVQMHFSAVGNRTNDIMRTLTVLTAIFLPLNLITGIFGMNFDSVPLIHDHAGFWVSVGIMLVVALGLGGWFWRKRYLETPD